eukprot:COSAG01_NODE_433_length_17113_cov_23.009757_4_plen_76_part_00
MTAMYKRMSADLAYALPESAPTLDAGRGADAGALARRSPAGAEPGHQRFWCELRARAAAAGGGQKRAIFAVVAIF